VFDLAVKSLPLIHGILPDLVTVSTTEVDSVDGEEYAGHGSQKQHVSHRVPYFNCDETEEKVVLSFGPMPFTVAMIASAMPPAIMQYSMAVAPD